MTTFIDTSAIYALLDADDDRHQAANETFAFLVNGETLLCHDYVLLEATVLLQRRVGHDAVRDLHDRLLPLLDVRWMDLESHRAAAESLIAAGRKRVSLVDWASFQLMRQLRIDDAFSFDRDFAAQGFTLIPTPQASDTSAISR